MTDPKVLLISGTDTGVGKTVLSVLWVRYLLRAGVRPLALKPVASGGRGDARALYGAQQRQVPLDVLNPWHFRAVLAPPLAALREGCCPKLSAVVKHVRTCLKHAPLVIVEGAGGLLSPMGEDFDSRDLLAALRATPILVAPNRLGTVHQVRAALCALPGALRGRAVVVLSSPSRLCSAARHNAALLREFEPETPIFTLPWLPRWSDPAAALSPRACSMLQALSAAVGIPNAVGGSRAYSDGARR